jgi:MtrB/PioB family decaheme-associated outer membrane protein
MPLKAPAVVAPAWWYEGYAEIGGRFFLNNPDKRYLGKFYEYRDLRPGVFGNFYYGAHRTGPDPLDIELWGKNIGWDDQAFGFDLYKPGTYYLTLGWDETPHFFGTGRTTFSDGNVLSTPQYPFPPSAATQTFVNANSHDIDVKYRRDTASAAARWTPTDNWDITADYSHTHRDGTQRLSAITFAPPTGRGGADTRASIELPKPVDDTTQNGNVKAEYAGTTPWGKSFNIALGGGVSFYDNNVGCGSVAGFRPAGSGDANCLTFQNPWIAANTAIDPLWNRYSLPPSNEAQTFTASGAVGLPFNSRYMGTFQYSHMAQNETFMASTINPLAPLATLTRGSLDGDARTTLSNNVLNTRITSDLSSTLRYRYYDYHSDHGPVTVLTNTFANPDTNNTNEAPITAHPTNFNKQNLSEQLDYRPWKWLNVGAAYEWERWQHEYADSVNAVTNVAGDYDLVTNENAVRVFADVKTWGWSTLRASVRYGERRVDGDYIRIANNNNAFRTVDAQNRDSTVVKTSWAIDVTKTITVTPTGGFRVDDYPTDGRLTFGINKYETWNVGGDIAWAITPGASVYLSYVHDNAHREVFQNTVPSNLVLDSTDFVDTFIVGGRFTVIPEKLFLTANYTFMRSNSQWLWNCGPGGCFAAPMPTAPDTHNTNHRVDVQAKYVFDEMVTRGWGLWPKTQAYLKARVLWEKNSTDSWQSIEQQLGWAVNPADLTMARSVFLGIPNPNYDVVVGMLAFGIKW